MVEKAYQIRCCLRPGCGFRFPVPVENAARIRCPKCRAPTQAVLDSFVNQTGSMMHDLPVGPQVEAVLDNIRSTFNVGAMFRSADGAGIRHVHLCGISPTPANPKVGKTALGAEQVVPWSEHPNTLDLVASLREKGNLLLALEGGPRAAPIFQIAANLGDRLVALVVGNEVSGVDPSVLGLCDQVVAIPMLGSKESLNVAIAFGIAVYTLRFPPASR